jgi:hypothetical protein
MALTATIGCSLIAGVGPAAAEPGHTTNPPAPAESTPADPSTQPSPSTHPNPTTSPGPPVTSSSESSPSPLRRALITAVLDGAHDTVAGVTVRIAAPSPYVYELPATIDSPTDSIPVRVLTVPAGLTLVGPSDFTIGLTPGETVTYTVHLTTASTSPGSPGGTVPGRDPAGRVPLTSIPSGPITRS